jgi:dTDP-L-rhamnose 4-epimerase
MRVLVTGGAGFIGSHTVDLLLARGHEVRILDALLPPVHRGGQPPAYLPPEAELMVGDVRDRDAWQRALQGVQAVFHFAAYQDYLPDFSTFFHVNAVGTALLYELAVAQHLPLQKIVIASTQAIYGEGRYPRCPRCGQALKPQVTPEDATISPHNSYAMSKFSEETLALALGKRYGLPTVALRYSITQGARQSFRNAYSGAMRIFAMQALAGQPLTVYEDGRQLRDFVYVGDVARANLLVFEDPRADYQVYNVGAGKACTVLELAECVAEHAGTGSRPLVLGEYRFGDTRHIVSDVSRLRALGWEPQGSIDSNTDEYLGWASSQPGFRNTADEARSYMRRVGAVRGG